MGLVRLLLVEDDEDDYIITRDLLDDIFAGAYHLDWASDLETARSLLSGNAHDVCLMDYSLGAVDGVTLLKEAHGLGFTRPIIMLTGQDDDYLDQQALSAGAVDYLVKSHLTKSRLARAIRYAVARRETELERMERLRAESENRAKTEFLAHLSHELRTPLTSILGYTDILLQQVEQDAVNSLHVIKRNGQHLLSLLNDVLDLSKIEAGKLEIEHQVVELSRFFSDIYHLLKVRADDRNIELEFVAQELVPDKIITDPTRLRQILLNILGNAIKFTHQGKVKLELSLGQRDTGEGENATCLQCRITDTGIGMSKDFLPKLFRPFVQANASPTSGQEGTGLGLAISRQLARRLGGDIAVESEPGVGSCFSLTTKITIPERAQWCSLDLATVTVGSESLPKPHITARILVADDVADLRVLLGQILTGMGADVEFADCGQEALAMALACPFDLILMDMQMPGMSGLEATRQLRKEGYGGPIVALTAATMQGERERCLAAGCSDFLSKPVVQERLLECIASQLNKVPVSDAVGDQRVLLVEDDQDAGAITSMLLESLGWQARHVSNGLEARIEFEQWQPRLVLMDLGLPDCDGSDLASELSKVASGVIFVALSGRELSSQEQNQSPFDYHLLKPIDLRMLQETLEKSVDKSVNSNGMKEQPVNK